MRNEYCKCKVCNKKFIYGDEQSPMFSNKIWNKVLKFYNLVEYEKEAANKYAEHVDRVGFWARHFHNEHCYICYKCVEKALNRKIRRSDLIGKNIPLNEDFEEMYFNNK